MVTRASTDASIWRCTGIDRLLAQSAGGATSYFTADHLGSLVRTTDGTGAPIFTREYDPWGNLLQGLPASGYAFTGREWDAEVSLYHYRARFYDPKLGRFLSQDPAGTSNSTTLYTYVTNDPISHLDPSGLFDLKAADAGATGAMRGIWPDCQKLRRGSDDEYCGNICECPDGSLLIGAPKKVKSGATLPECKDGKLVGGYHCHPPGGDWPELFSDEDQDLVLFKGLKVIYLLTPSGYMKRQTKWGGVKELGRLSTPAR